MRRFQIILDDEIDEALAREARSRGTSKAEVLRSLAREALVPLPPISSDPLVRMAGRDDYDPAPIDEVVYG